MTDRARVRIAAALLASAGATVLPCASFAAVQIDVSVTSGKAAFQLVPTLLHDALRAQSSIRTVGRARLQDGGAETGFEIAAKATDRGLFEYPENDRDAARPLRAFAGGGDQIERTVSLRIPGPASKRLTVEFNGGGIDARATTAATIDRLFEPAYQTSRDIEAVYWGAHSSLFGGRLDVKSYFGQAEGRQFAFAAAGAGLSRRPIEGNASWHRLNAKLIDTPGYKLIFDGTLVSVDPNYRTQEGARPTGFVTAPGDLATASLRFVASKVKFGVSMLNRRTPWQGRANQTLSVGYRSSSLSLYRDEARRFLWLTGATISREPATGATIEFAPNELAAGLGSSPAPIFELLPTLVSIDIAKGESIRPVLGPLAISGSTLRTTNDVVTWDWRLGETTLLYWNERRGPGISGRARNDLLDLSHTVKRGNWRLGIGITYMKFATIAPDWRWKDTDVSGNLSFAYEPSGGIALEARYGANVANSRFDQSIPTERRTTHDLRLSADLSSFVRRKLNDPEASLRAEYRRRINSVETQETQVLGSDQEQCCEAFLVTFTSPIRWGDAKSVTRRDTNLLALAAAPGSRATE